MAAGTNEMVTAEAIVLSRIQVRYKDQAKVTLDIDQLTITQNERTSLIGPSGSGKTTLLRVINGYVPPTSGNYYVMGHKMTLRDARRRNIRRRIGFVFQNFNLLERASVFENVLWGRLGHVSTLTSLPGEFSEVDKQLVLKAVQEVDLLDQVGQRCDTLSGGQQQRVAIARVLAQEPEIILADEPVSSLDPSLANDILKLLYDVSKARSVTLLMSLHQPELARRYTDRIVGLRAGQVVFDGKPEELDETGIRNIYGRETETTRATS